MSFPVFRHTISKLREVLVENSNKVSSLIKYDPIIAYLIFYEVNKPCTKTEITNFSQMVNYIGTKKIEQIIIERDLFLEVEDLHIWVYGILSAEISTLIQERFSHSYKDEAFFVGLLPCLGLLFMMDDFPRYRNIIHFLIKIPIEDRVFIEDSIFGTNHIDTLKRNIICSPFKDIVNILNKMFSKDGKKNQIKTVVPQTGSSLRRFYELTLLSDVASYGAQALMFPSVVENLELFLELVKRYFRIKESDSLEILQNAMDRFILIAKEFNIFEEIFSTIDKACPIRKFQFKTKNPIFANMLKDLFEQNANDRNIYIFGEEEVGKRLLAAALYTADDNPRREKPFVMIFCDIEETLEEEFFGIKEGYLGKKGKNGVLINAKGGTLVIKEFDEMPKDFQEKFQKAIHNRKFYRVGDINPIEFPDIKFILIGKEDIRIKVAKGEFSRELLKLLNPVFLKIPPLRERREDVFYITEEIVRKYNLNIEDELAKPEIIEKLKKDPFLNNLRDLKRFLFLLYIQKIFNK